MSVREGLPDLVKAITIKPYRWNGTEWVLQNPSVGGETVAMTFPEIDAKQYEIRGYGESQSIAGNDTPKGRSRNRRVEFKVLNHELLRRELDTGTSDRP